MYFLLIYLLKFTIFFFAIEILEYQFDNEIFQFSVYYQNSYCMNQQFCLLEFWVSFLHYSLCARNIVAMDQKMKTVEREWHLVKTGWKAAMWNNPQLELSAVLTANSPLHLWTVTRLMFVLLFTFYHCFNNPMQKFSMILLFHVWTKPAILRTWVWTKLSFW